MDGRPEQADDQEGAYRTVGREAALDHHVTQLVQPDECRCQREPTVDQMENMETDRCGGVDDLADQP